jgi:hypothetical protein
VINAFVLIFLIVVLTAIQRKRPKGDGRRKKKGKEGR